MGVVGFCLADYLISPKWGFDDALSWHNFQIVNTISDLFRVFQAQTILIFSIVS